MPAVLVKFSHTIFGKLVLLSLLGLMTLYNRTGGLLIAMFIIFLMEFNYEHNTYEGFESGSDDFRKKHCLGNQLKDEAGKTVELMDIAKVFPKLAFLKQNCNPCEKTCSFSYSDSKERIHTEETLKPVDSKNVLTGKK
jgi:hypothetical protein